MYRGVTNPPLRGGKERIRAQTNGCVANKRGGDNLQGRPIPFHGSFRSAYASSRRFLERAALEAVAWRESKRFGGAPAHESDAKTHRTPKALRAKAILAPPPRLLWRRRLGAQEAEDDTKINRRRGKIPVPFMRWAGSTSTRPG